MVKLVSVFFLLVSLNSQALLPANRVETRVFPSTVALMIYVNPSQYMTCTAVKVSAFVFMTAAHCFDGLRADQIKVLRIGPERFDNDSVEARVSSLIVHPGYSTKLRNLNSAVRKNPDIAFIKIDKETRNIPVVHLGFQELQAGQKIYVGGHGSQTDKECPLAYIPCSLNMRSQVITSVGSTHFYSEPSVQFPGFITGGDSGGPVYIRDKKGFQQVIGINNSGSPTLNELFRLFAYSEEMKFTRKHTYLKISTYQKWILETIRTLN